MQAVMNTDDGIRVVDADEPSGAGVRLSVVSAITVHSAAAADYFPHPQVAFVPLEGRECQIAVAVRSDDHRPAIEIIRHIAPMLSGGATPTWIEARHMSSGTNEIDSGLTLQETASR
jgi:hypothetical protein